MKLVNADFIMRKIPDDRLEDVLKRLDRMEKMLKKCLDALVMPLPAACPKCGGSNFYAPDAEGRLTCGVGGCDWRGLREECY